MSADGTMNQNNNPCTGEHPFNSLPGDPSLHLVTNVDLGDKKMDIMKGKFKARVSSVHKICSVLSVLF